MSAGAILGGASIGAGVGVSSVALAPFNAANTFMGSAFFGYGMILGERYMYQADWPKIQARLEHGEQIENIIQEYTGTFTAVVMKEAKIIFDTVTREFISIMREALSGEGSILEGQPRFISPDAPTIGDPRRTPIPTPPTTKTPQTPTEFFEGPKPPSKPRNIPTSSKTWISTIPDGRYKSIPLVIMKAMKIKSSYESARQYLISKFHEAAANQARHAKARRTIPAQFYNKLMQDYLSLIGILNRAKFTTLPFK